MRLTILSAFFSLLIAVSPFVNAAENGLNQDGYLIHWAVLAPFPFPDVENGAEALGKSQVEKENKLSPKIGDKVKAGDVELVWKELKSNDDIVDLNALMGKETEASVAYAVTTIDAPEAMESVKMKIGSDDQCRIYLNGVEVLSVYEPRPLEKDQDMIRVNLKKGANVLIMKVVNQTVDWSFTIRFVDASGNGITTLKAHP